jgi:cyanophycin synthetase
MGANPYLETGALVFNLALTEYNQPLPVEDYVSVIGDRYPTHKRANIRFPCRFICSHRRRSRQTGYGFALQPLECKAIRGLQKNQRAIAARTHDQIRTVFVWDWFEAITQKEDIAFEEQMRSLQNRFRQSVYGGPTVYTLLRTAYEKGIPSFYLWEEGLMQYGYGKKTSSWGSNHI